MKLYGRRSSINVQKVLWCLAELGLEEGRDFERIDAGLHFGVVDTPEFRALNPNGLVPTLVEDGRVLWESNTIVRYLAATRGGDSLLPADPAARADVERWMDWQLATLWSTLRVAFLGLTRTPEHERNYDAIRTSHAQAARMLGIVDALLARQPFLAQDRFTLADVCVALSAERWYSLARNYPERLEPAPELPSLQAWFTAATQRPSYAKVVGT
ncbi:glutathione S-transferase family protein [Caballeronia telluris]|uniref:Glutathione S-transferase n=1 Tax=Caballeronia telluris TaxID=326475 RepID=A0A158GH99_9BURK|nr:glutathione S-transferase family protein [Caballeronia telluris]SAL31495.1 glutathione S-transferase [Caballeronia telluris]